jgi:sugar phosphate isomerase/epimerase
VSVFKTLVFTKPWPDLSFAELGKMVRGMGFDGIELPVRPGFQVTPGNVFRELPEAKRILAEQGVDLVSVASTADQSIVAACGNAGVSVLRVMVSIDLGSGYFATEGRVRRRFDALIPHLEKRGVTLGVQNHSGAMIGSAVGIMHLIEGYDPKHVGAVLDLAHCSLNGEPEEMAIDIVWSHLLLVNLKSACRRRTGSEDEKDTEWRTYWTPGGFGIVNWRRAIRELKRRAYSGFVCLTAEYTLPLGEGSLVGDAAAEAVREDLQYVRCLEAEC